MLSGEDEWDVVGIELHRLRLGDSACLSSMALTLPRPVNSTYPTSTMPPAPIGSHESDGITIGPFVPV